MKRWAIPMIVLLAGCPPQNQYTTSGESLWQHFPFDGVRHWEYISTDLQLSYKLVGDMRPEDPDPESESEFTIYHVDWTTDCVAADDYCVDGELVRSIGWSSDITNGTMIHSFSEGTSTINYDPPLVVAPREIKVGEVVETTTDGQKWSSQLIGFDPCDMVRMQGESFQAANCAAHIVLSDGDSNAATNYGLAGEYWVAKGLGIVGFSLEGDEGETWGLSKSVCDETESRSCNGDW